MIKSLSRFHNYEIVRRVFQILMILNDIDPQEGIQEFIQNFDMKSFIKFGNVNMVNPSKLKSVSGLLKNNPGLNYETVKSFSKKFGIFFQFMISMVRCYELNMRYAVILHKIEERKEEKRQETLMGTSLLSRDAREQLRPQKSVHKFEFDFNELPQLNKKNREPYFSRDIRKKYGESGLQVDKHDDVLMTRIDYEIY